MTGPPVSVEAEYGGHLLVAQFKVKDLELGEWQHMTNEALAGRL